MVPFLRQVAAHYLSGPDIVKHCFVFPNRRSLVFFRKYLADILRDTPGAAPLEMPPLLTVNDFFYRISGVRAAGRLQLLLVLYESYRSLYENAEPLDEFIFWGEILLADFDDIDKYLAPAGALMRNVEDFKAIEDSFEYLSARQKDAIQGFLSHFRDGGGKPAPGKDGVKARFLKLWNILFPLYTNFREALSERGMAYEGMVYRSLAGRLTSGESIRDILCEHFPETENFVFVGLNALNECERLVMAKMRDAGIASFVWDYVSREIKDPENKSSFFMRRNVEDFPQAFPIDLEDLEGPEITVISVPSCVGQVKLAPYILGQIGPDSNPVETAFVLPEENLLLPLLNSIPPEYGSINVTMGYPMSGSAVYTLLDTLGRMQLRTRQSGGKWYFYHRELREVLSSSLLKSFLTPQEEEAASAVRAQAKYFVPPEDLDKGPLMSLLFRPVLTEGAVASAGQNHRIEDYFLEILSFIGNKLSAGEDLLELDFAKRCFSEITILKGIDLELLPSTYLSMLGRVLEGISVPFQGEPLEGLQIMGPLETRALDFQNLIILSASEGVFPRRSVSASFIPPELRRGFGLPTYEFQDAVWAYYFYRMIQRPRKVWLIYDNRTEGIRTGEETRYIKQLEYHFRKPIRRLNVSAPLSSTEAGAPITKTAGHVEKLRERRLSASAIQNYLACPARFYYQMVENLQPGEDIAESLDAGMLGNVFHHVMERLYSGKPYISRADIESMKSSKKKIREMVREEILREMNSIEVSGRNLVLENILEDYVTGTLEHDLRLLKEAGSEGFNIIGLEKPISGEIDGFSFVGRVDRMDSYRPGEVRIVDYKTGKVTEDDILITDENAAAVVEKLFGPSGKDSPKIALQLYLYDLMAPVPEGSRKVNSIYSTAGLYSGPLPDVPVSGEFTRLAAERLSDCLKEIADVSVPWRLTTEEKNCEWCNFREICGK